MSKKKLLFVFGTRPEAIKMAPLILEFKKHADIFDIKVCVTGQHREMLDQILDLFSILPDYDLNIMKVGQDLYDITTKVLIGMREVLQLCSPDLVFVHGDTSTSTAAALAAFYKKITIAHIEAGLRTRNIYSPWPEEINRQITARLSNFHFTPTDTSKLNLLNEAIDNEKIFVTGNSVIDALHIIISKINSEVDFRNKIIIELNAAGISKLNINSWSSKTNQRKMILITGHRRENFGDGFIEICTAIKELAINFENIDFVYPMHLNPNVRSAINTVFGDYNNPANKFSNLFFIEPLDYLPFVFLMNISYLVLTDSGGIQEEAPSLGKPVLVMRENTERPEAVSSGTVILVGTNKFLIIEKVTNLINNYNLYKEMAKATNPYGNGTTSKKIVLLITSLMENKEF